VSDAPRILVVEDEAIVALDLASRLRALGYQVAAIADTADAALERAAELSPDLVLMDIHLRDGSDGAAAAVRLRRELGLPVVFLTALADDATLERAKQASPLGYVVKPFSESDLRVAIEIALHRERAERAERRGAEAVVAIFDDQQLGMLLLDGEGNVLFSNRVLNEMLGETRESLRSLPWQEALGLDADARERVAALLRRGSGSREKVETSLSCGASEARVVEIGVERDPRNASRPMLVVRDVTELNALRRLAREEVPFHEIVGRSAAMRRVIESVRQVARFDATVLVQGETGTGKELIARALHRESPRRDRPFVAVNCAGFSEELAASQLFGHRRGAFTGAVSDARGVFEEAHGGTLLLDEVGELPPRIQTALLRVLEERTITRVGEATPRAVNVRIVAATHRDLGAEATAGRFRSDLLYRLRVGRIQLPPLRERREDLWPLLQHFLAEQRALTGRAIESLGDEARAALLSYDWPGNVRELRNAIAFAAIHAPGPIIQLEDLPPELLDAAKPAAPQAELAGDERARIVEALARTGGERKAAAALLGIGRATLYRKLGQYGIA
jgi:PAS domain S-box-containing protein